MSDEYGGLLDDAAEAWRLRPVLAAVKAAREERDTVRKLQAIVKAVELWMDALGIDRRRSVGLEFVALVSDLAAHDQRVAALVERIIPPA